MTPRSLFNIILKIFGLCFLKNIVETVSELISAVIFMFKPNTFDQGEETLILFATLVILALYVFITYQLLFKTNNVLNKLKLEKDFIQEEFLLEITQSTILIIAMIVLGGLILTNEIPNLCNALYQYIQQQKGQRYTGTKPNFSYTLITSTKIIIGLLIIGERKRIVEFALRKEKIKNVDS